MTELKSEIVNIREDNHCNNCIMKKTNPSCLEGFVPFEKPLFAVPFDSPDIVLVGEGPGSQEVTQGKPFIGDSGQLIRSILDESGYRYAICNVVCCRTDNSNRDPLPEERMHCSYYARKFIEKMNPTVVLLAGKHPSHTLLEDTFSHEYTKLTITTLQDKHPIINLNGRKYLPIFHPAYFLHGGAPFSKEQYKDRVISRLRLAIEGSAYKHRFKIFDRSEMTSAFDLIKEELITLDYETIGLPFEPYHRLLGFGISDSKNNIYVDFSSSGDQFPTDEESKVFLDFVKKKKTVVYNTSFETLATYRNFKELVYYDDAYTMCKILQEVASLKENAQNLCEAPGWVDGVQTLSNSIQKYVELVMSIKKLNDAQKKQLILLDTHIVLSHIEDDTFYLDEIDWEAQKKKNRDKKLEKVVQEANNIKELLGNNVEEYHQKLERYCFDKETPLEWWGWASVPVSVMAEYCTLDCHWTLVLRNVVWSDVEKQYQYYISQEFLGTTMRAYGFYWNDNNAQINEDYYKKEASKYLQLLVNLPQYRDKLKEKYVKKHFQMSMKLRQQIIKWRKDNELDKLPVDQYKLSYPEILNNTPDEFVLEVDNEWEKFNKDTDLLFKSDDFEVLKTLFNPLSTVKENSSFFWEGVVTERLEKAATLYYLRKELSYDEKCLEVLQVVNLKDYDDVLEWLMTNSKRPLPLIGRATKHAKEMSSGLNDDCFVEWYDILNVIFKVDIDDETTWIPEFYPIYYCRRYKKVQKSLNTYINGKCGRNRVYEIEPVNDVNEIPVRKKSYHNTPNKDTDFILDTDFGVCIAECLTGDTRIRLFPSSSISLSQLHDFYKQYPHKHLTTYSRDTSGNQIEAPITDVFISGYVNTILELKLENGQMIKCTPNHRFLLKDGTYKEAQHLMYSDEIQEIDEEHINFIYDELKRNKVLKCSKSSASISGYAKNSNADKFLAKSSFNQDINNSAGRTLTEKIYTYSHNLKNIPTCPICNDFRTFLDLTRGYISTCGNNSCVNILFTKMSTEIQELGMEEL